MVANGLTCPERASGTRGENAAGGECLGIPRCANKKKSRIQFKIAGQIAGKQDDASAGGRRGNDKIFDKQMMCP